MNELSAYVESMPRHVPITLDPENPGGLYHLMTCRPMPGGTHNYDVVSMDNDVVPGSNLMRKRVAGSLACLLARFEETPPDAIGLTMFSAIPAMDAFRGYYEELGVLPPAFFPVPREGYHSMLPRRLAAIERRYINNQRKITGICTGSTVAVVDQYIHTGVTLESASRFVAAAGASSVMRNSKYTQWYEQGYDIDDKRTWPKVAASGRMTSPYGKFMRKIGRACAPIVSEHGDALREISRELE